MENLELKEKQLTKYKIISYLFIGLCFLVINIKLLANGPLEHKYLFFFFWFSSCSSFVIGFVAAAERVDLKLNWIFWPIALYFSTVNFVTENLILMWGGFVFNLIVASNSYIIQKKYEDLEEEKFSKRQPECHNSL